MYNNIRENQSLNSQNSNETQQLQGSQVEDMESISLEIEPDLNEYAKNALKSIKSVIHEIKRSTMNEDIKGTLIESIRAIVQHNKQMFKELHQDDNISLKFDLARKDKENKRRRNNTVAFFTISIFFVLSAISLTSYAMQSNTQNAFCDLALLFITSFSYSFVVYKIYEIDREYKLTNTECMSLSIQLQKNNNTPLLSTIYIGYDSNTYSKHIDPICIPIGEARQTIEVNIFPTSYLNGYQSIFKGKQYENFTDEFIKLCYDIHKKELPNVTFNEKFKECFKEMDKKDGICSKLNLCNLLFGNSSEVSNNTTQSMES